MVYDIIEIVRVYGIESGGYGLGMSDGMWWWYSEGYFVRDIWDVYGMVLEYV